jgi:hypothetical protein
MDDQDRLKGLDHEKEQMIREYLSLQDKADGLNEEIYKVCCHIEALNAQIVLAQEAIRRAALKPPPANGTAHPPQGLK